jgi:hypothetical protein
MRKFIAAASVAVTTVLAVASVASADVPRDQVQTATLTSTVHYQGTDYVHTYNINIAGGTFTGTGSVLGSIPETISGTMNGSAVSSFSAAYQNGSGYTWNSAGSDSLGQTFSVTNVLTNVTDTFKNHGQYVSQNGGGDDAAHSSIGMPINSSK